MKVILTGLNHITLSVKNLEQSFTFYKDVLCFKPLIKKQRSAYFLCGELWFCIEEDQNARAHELPEYTHIAFSISQNEFELMRNKLQQFGVKEFKKNSSEGDSIYFLDPNGHKLEIHVGNWKTRLQKYLDDPKCEFFISKSELEAL